jgi:hypothetical protein
MEKWAALLFLLPTACAGNQTPGNAIAIGALVDRTGSDSTPSWSDSISLAISDMNAGLARSRSYSGTVQFQVLFRDTVNTPSLATSKAKDLVARGVKALLTDTSQDHVAVNRLNYDPSVTGFGVPAIGFAPSAPSIGDPNATDPDPLTQASLRDPNGWSFRTSMASTPQAQVLMEIALSRGNNGDVNNDGQFKVLIYGSGDVANIGFAAAISAAAAQLHPTPPPIVHQLFHSPSANLDTYDFAGDLTKLLNVDPPADLIIDVDFVNYVVAIQRAYAQTKSTVPWLHIHTFRRVPVLRGLLDAANNHEGTSPVLFDSTPSGETFNRELTAAILSAPDVWDANAYDAAVLAMLAVLFASSSGGSDPSHVTPAQVRDGLRQINDPAGEVVGTGPDELARAADLVAAKKRINYQGASGPVDFDAHGNVREPLAHWIVQDEQFVDREQFDCVQSDACPKIK